MNEANSPSRRAWMHSVLARYEGPLTRYATRITHDVESARDVTQETFLRLCAQDPAQMDGHLAEWLFTVCRNRALDVKRKEGRMQALSEIEIQADSRVDHDPAEIAEGRETAGRAMQAISQLPDNQQEVIRLRFQNGLSYKEIAGVTKLSVTNVGYLIHTAIKAIRVTLNT